MNETKYIIYKITNLINEKIYIGCHKCTDINDDYMGSGTYLKRAQNKYGIENFSKEILEVFDNPEEMFNMESQLVNEEFIEREDVYNLKLGGYGGFDHLNSDYDVMVLRNTKASMKARDILQELYADKESEWYISRCKPREDYVKIKISKTLKLRYENGEKGSMTGKGHSEKTKDQMKETHKKNKHQQGEKNSQFGKIWIYNLDEKVSKRIEKVELPEYENLGWLKGRKMKF